MLLFLLFGIGGGGKTGSTAILQPITNKGGYLLNCVFDHGGDEARDVGRAELEAGVRVHFNEPRFQVLIQQKVVPKNLPRKLAPHVIHLT